MNYRLLGDWQELHRRDANYPSVSPFGIEPYAAWHQDELKRIFFTTLRNLCVVW
jgi:hypothetical protein